MAFFSQYGSEIYGVTGTLRCEYTRAFVSKTFGVDFIRVPRFRERRFEVKAPLVGQNYVDWLQLVGRQVIHIAVEIERPVLVISESVQEVDSLNAQILSQLIKLQKEVEIHLYTDDAESDYFINAVRGSENNIDRAMIILATNLAGRGTDLPVSDSISVRGGLHVIISFMPANSRVQRQNFGRPAHAK